MLIKRRVKMTEKANDFDERSKVALGALLATLDINPANLYRLKTEIPNHYLCKHLIDIAFAGKTAKDLSPALIKEVTENIKVNVSKE